MRDRQYLRSMAASAAAACACLCAILLFVRWAGWGGALGLAAAAGLFLAWFYGGPRPDLAARRNEDPGEGAGSE